MGNDAFLCQNCGKYFLLGQITPLEEVKNLLQRVGPGETFPAGECKECGGLVHPLDSVASPMPIDRALMVLNVTLRNLTDKVDEAIGEMRKKTNIEVKRLEYNKTKETLAALQKLTELGKDGILPEELTNVVGVIQAKMKSRKKGEEKDGDSDAGGA